MSDWGIEPFAQWGVELGKALAQQISPELASETEPLLTRDSSTNALPRRYRGMRARTREGTQTPAPRTGHGD